jgi:AcrR family transcriptional regulator
VPDRTSRPDVAPAPARRWSLSREEIADAALALVDREGVEALTMRRLAADLGVGTMTVYGYFRDKDELMDAAVERGALRVDFSVGHGPWEERLRDLMRTLLRSLTEHPSVVQLRTRRPILNPAAMRACESGLEILAEAGLGPVESARAWRLLFVYAFGYAAFGSPAASAEVETAWREQLAALPPEVFPLTVSVAAEAAAALSGHEQFEHGLDLIIAGLTVRGRSGGEETDPGR